MGNDDDSSQSLQVLGLGLDGSQNPGTQVARTTFAEINKEAIFFENGYVLVFLQNLLVEITEKPLHVSDNSIGV